MATGVQQQSDILPEEEALFREFQSYVRSIYSEASHGVLAQVDGAVTGLKNSVNSLTVSVDGTTRSFCASVDGAAKRLTAEVDRAAKRLDAQGDELAQTTIRCRQDYVNLFDPAIKRFAMQGEAAVNLMVAQLDNRISIWEQTNTKLYQNLQQQMKQTDQTLQQQLATISASNEAKLQSTNAGLKQQLMDAKKFIVGLLVALIVLVIFNIIAVCLLVHR